jgi:hypothetical protein
MKTLLILVSLLASSLAQASDCTVLSGGRELLSTRKTIQVGSTYYNLAITIPDLISQPTCVSTPPVGVVDPVLSVASMGTNTFSLPQDSRVQLVVSQWDGAHLRELARVYYSTIKVSKMMISVLIVPIETVYYDFSDSEVHGNFESLPKEVTSFYELNFRFFLASGPASFTFHEPDPTDSSQDLSLQSDEDKFQMTTTDDSDPTPAPASLN